jgi:hypothetical protein
LVIQERKKKANIFVRRDKQFDTAAFANYLGITLEECKRLMRYARGNSEVSTVPIELADRVYSALALQDQMAVDYPIVK